ncbi:hypothetical protein K493DRAFT_411757 [Basidiobolus meristosporus CBS 931.73]|uniref:Uncharacterized protein n=1 Tax=Basidiobolus meristosporus CBS 931.73 TaxID=1314790 RepID=A0A1Y1XAW1_9FUNG|nr:hypothetical protein K493DRAFT_411757 [Basidiobolus meristosporus CBS 931.73]|eukprot:ORX82857.1 hypothetical protein K493DRAFT_411757 [Basidiobolus meristosporus CBS 931.73]
MASRTLVPIIHTLTWHLDQSRPTTPQYNIVNSTTRLFTRRLNEPVTQTISKTEGTITQSRKCSTQSSTPRNFKQKRRMEQSRNMAGFALTLGGVEGLDATGFHFYDASR